VAVAVVVLLASAVLLSFGLSLFRRVIHFYSQSVGGRFIDGHFERSGDRALSKAALKACRVRIAVRATTGGLASKIYRQLTRRGAHDAHQVALRPYGPASDAGPLRERMTLRLPR
jgi:hypothetical protein